MYRHNIPEFVPIGISDRSRGPKLTIRNVPINVTEIRSKFATHDESDRFFLTCLFQLYGESEFVRGNLDAGRLNRVFESIIFPAGANFNSRSLDARLRIDAGAAKHFISTGEI